LGFTNTGQLLTPMDLLLCMLDGEVWQSGIFDALHSNILAGGLGEH
jgi:hypothetical protein